METRTGYASSLRNPHSGGPKSLSLGPPIGNLMMITEPIYRTDILNDALDRCPNVVKDLIPYEWLTSLDWQPSDKERLAWWACYRHVPLVIRASGEYFVGSICGYDLQKKCTTFAIMESCLIYVIRSIGCALHPQSATGD